MEMTEDSIDPAVRQRISAVIHSVLGQQAGRLGEMVCNDSERIIGENLQRLIEIIRHTRSEQIEPYLIQFLEDICAHCPYQYPSLHCARRHLHACALFECASALVAGVASVLREAGDQEYQQIHA